MKSGIRSPVLIVMLSVILLFQVLSFAPPVNAASQIPSWFQSNAKWFTQGLISEKDMLNAIEHLMKEKIIRLDPTKITIPQTTQQKQEAKIPSYTKDVFRYWSEGQVSDSEIGNSIEYMVNTGIISSSAIQAEKAAATSAKPIAPGGTTLTGPGTYVPHPIDELIDNANNRSPFPGDDCSELSNQLVHSSTSGIGDSRVSFNKVEYTTNDAFYIDVYDAATRGGFSGKTLGTYQITLSDLIHGTSTTMTVNEVWNIIGRDDSGGGHSKIMSMFLMFGYNCNILTAEFVDLEGTKRVAQVLVQKGPLNVGHVQHNQDILSLEPSQGVKGSHFQVHVTDPPRERNLLEKVVTGWISLVAAGIVAPFFGPAAPFVAVDVYKDTYDSFELEVDGVAEILMWSEKDNLPYTGQVHKHKNSNEKLSSHMIPVDEITLHGKDIIHVLYGYGPLHTIFIVNNDSDADGIMDWNDNCVNLVNNDQSDNDSDGLGNPCDTDDDNDGILDAQDNCKIVANPDQKNTDGDILGDVCDPSPVPIVTDDDNDGVFFEDDNCPTIYNPNQENNDGDSQGDMCDTDDDNDQVKDTVDNCIFDWNKDQKDADGDAQGDICDSTPTGPIVSPILDTDNDGIVDAKDVCPTVSDPNQTDTDGDGDGDLCDLDDDNDGINDRQDNCPTVKNPNQENLDRSDDGDACDRDIDNDAIDNEKDNCPRNINNNQKDSDDDGIGDVCDPTPYPTITPQIIDRDKDGIPDNIDNCPTDSNSDQKDSDGNGIGDACEDPTVVQRSEPEQEPVAVVDKSPCSDYDMNTKYQSRFGEKTNDGEAKDGGRYQHFENSASIHCHEDVGPYFSEREIRQKWADFKWERGILGWPQSDTNNTPDGIGKWQRFEGGYIHWSQSTGAHETHGEIMKKWRSMGWENSYLGYPTTDEQPVNGVKYGTYNVFQGGIICYHPDSGATDNQATNPQYCEKLYGAK